MNALQTTLKQLRLSGLIQTLDVRPQEAAANRFSHAEFLELICQDELNVRQQRDVSSILRRGLSGVERKHGRTKCKQMRTAL